MLFNHSFSLCQNEFPLNSTPVGGRRGGEMGRKNLTAFPALYVSHQKKKKKNPPQF